MSGLKKSQFAHDPELIDPQPDEITAHENGIAIVAWAGPDKHEVFLSPRHISAIIAMYEDWWESHWAELHESQT